MCTDNFVLFIDFLEINKPDRARIRVESIIREDVSIENEFDQSMTHRVISIKLFALYSFVLVFDRGNGDLRDVL